MTTPVTVAAPAPRTAAGRSGGGATDNAAPFASALDGALADSPVRDATCSGGGNRTGGDTAAEDDGGTTEDVVAAPAATVAGVPATLWALSLAGSPMTPGTAPGTDTGTVTGAAAVPGLDALGATAPTAPGVAALPGAAPAVPVGATGAAADLAAPGAPLPAAAAAASGTGRPAGQPPGPVTGQAAPAASDLSVVLAADGWFAGTAAPVAVPPGEAPDAGAPGHAALAGAVPAAPPAPADGGGTPGDGRPDREPGAARSTASPAADGESVLPPVLPGPGPAAGPIAPVATVAAADAAATPAAPQPVSGQVARQVAVLSSAGDGAHTMTLVLNPENLGPVEVQLTVAQGSLDLHLRGAHDLGRAALIDALPELRRDLEAAGLSPSRVEVDADTGGSWLARHTAEQQAQQGSGDRGARQYPTGERSRSGGLPADSGDGPTRLSTRSTSSGVDVRV